MNTIREILVVEDNEDDAHLTLLALRQGGAIDEVVVVPDAESGLDYLRGTGRYSGQGQRQPAVVFLDLNLPRMSGHEFLRRVRAEGDHRFQPIVVLTTSSERRDVAEAYRHGANAYVQKPTDQREFTSLMGPLGRFWLTENVHPSA